MNRRLISTEKDGSMTDNQNIRSYLHKKGIASDEFVRAGLSHGKKIAVVGKEDGGLIIPEVDGLMTEDPIYLGVTVADCLPVYIFFGNFHGILHAGWRGLHGGIIENAVEKIEEMGEDPAETSVFVGPSIRVCHFEVKDDLVREFSEYPDCFRKEENKNFLNLQKVVENKFNRFGIKRIIVSSECTYCNNKYFSYRRDKKLKSMLALAGPNKN